MEPEYESYSNYEHEHASLMDQLKLKVQIHHFDNLSRTECETFNLPTIVFKKLFSQEGHDYLRTHLSEVFFLTSDMIDHLITNIICEVQQLYNIDIVDEEGDMIETPFNHSSVFSLSLEMEIREDDIGEEVEIEIEEEYYDESVEECGMVPASKEAIERMKTTCDMNVTTLKDTILCCSICMDEFDDINKTCNMCKMPCNHVFHEQCIVKWLQTSHTCPLCRYSMPTTHNS